jgi:hypothetical protein
VVGGKPVRIALLNLSAASDHDVVQIGTALQVYLQHVATAWERAPIEIAFMPGVGVAPDGWNPLVVFDKPDQPGLEGYHDVDGTGRPYGRAFLNTVPDRVVLRDTGGKGASLAGVLSHEAAEMALDVLANAWQDGPFVDPLSQRSYQQVATELCDPVQEQSYAIGDVDVSNFVYPAWFNRRAAVGQRVDHLGKLAMSLTLAPGGYAIVRGSVADEQVFARLFRRGARKPTRIDHATPQATWRERMKTLRGGRTVRRLTGS